MEFDFKSHESEIVAALKTKARLAGNWTVVSFFINQPVQEAISGSITLGGPTLPSVAVINQETGEIKYFSLKFLLGDKVNL